MDLDVSDHLISVACPVDVNDLSVVCQRLYSKSFPCCDMAGILDPEEVIDTYGKPYRTGRAGQLLVARLVS
jgi:hypothetical protein